MGITIDVYRQARERVIAAGFAHDITWSEGLAAPATPEVLAQEAIWVICNSGMKHTIARSIYRRVMHAIAIGLDPHEVFGHAGKAGAIATIWRDRAQLFAAFGEAADRVAWCGDLPWVGEITKFHLAKNLGVDCAKPDRWLVRLAAIEGETVDGLCCRLATASGDRIGTVDYVLWRACAAGLLLIVPQGIAFQEAQACA